MENAKKQIKSILYFYLFYGVLFIPFPFYIIPFQKNIVQFIFERPLRFIVVNTFNIPIQNTEITSDSAMMYALFMLLFLLSIITVSIINLIKIWKEYEDITFNIFSIILNYYLSLQLLKYGCHKLFKGQFYLPEPNILYTPFGSLDKDILYWSTMGVSHSYNMFMGMLEIIPALLLMHKKTRVLGLLMTLAVFINIVAINFSFDISVKLYSLFLLALTIVLLLPYLNSFYSYFINSEKTTLPKHKNISFKSSFISISLKSFVILFIFTESLLPYINTMNWNDDKQLRPYLHGAYEVQKAFDLRGDKISLDSFSIKRIFIHRNGYIIFQDNNDRMQDFKLDIDQNKSEFILTDYELNQREISYQYKEEYKILLLRYFAENNEFRLELKALDWEELPVLQDDFHWMIEGVE
jgi:hypothetical protein